MGLRNRFQFYEFNFYNLYRAVGLLMAEESVLQ